MAKKSRSKKDSVSGEPGRMAWGRTTGLLVACAATIMGAFQGVGLAHLLFRAAVGSVVVCLVVGCFARLVSLMAPETDASQ